MAAAAFAGLLLVACFPKIHLPGLAWVACLPLLLVLSVEKRLKHAFLLGYVCGAVFFAGSCYWFVTVMELYGHLASALSVLALILFVLIDATFFGGFGLAMGWAARRSSGWALAASPFLWMAMELARTYLITGFPWNLLGYGVQAPGVRQVASVTGVYGLSFLAVATSAMIAWALQASSISARNAKLEIRNSSSQARSGQVEPPCQPPEARDGSRPTSTDGVRSFSFSTRPRVVGALAAWLTLLLIVQWWLAPPPATRGKNLAVLIQPNVPLDDTVVDWAPWKDPTQLNQLVQFSEEVVASASSSDLTATIQNPKSKIQNPAAPEVLLVWAENPAPFYFTRDPVFRSAMQNMARQTHAFVIGNTVIPVDARGENITNSAFTLDPEGREISRYDKIHLVPFGEYVPWWALPGLVHKITSEVGNFVPGSSYAVGTSAGGGIGVFICYEAIIPQLARRLVANGAGVLVNISNDAWYGDSAAAYQHLEMARLRAIENHRYLLRATNDGLTTLIDPYGRVLDELPRYRRLALPAHFDFETGETFYTAHGDLFAWLAAGIGLLMLVRGRRS